MTTAGTFPFPASLRWTLTLLLFAPLICLNAQRLPLEMRLSEDGRRLITGDQPGTGLYDEQIIRRVDLVFDQPNFWQQLLNNYADKIDLPATLIMDGVSYEQVGVRFKGQTSYTQIINRDKKSFNITMDYADENQDLMGYETMNFNNAYEDPSFIREMLYLHFSRRHTPAAKAAYVHLYINGEDWGIYPHIQQLNGDFFKEWFLSNDGTRWRAERVGGFGGPGGGGFGAGTSSLNYLGADTSLYTPHYTLKKAKKDNPWDDLVLACDVLNNVPLAELTDTLKKVLDIDRALWFMAHEIIFGDDDGYINKGGMDYYVYWDVDTRRLVPIEYDGNSTMKSMTASWSPFYRENDNRFPLMNRLSKVPELRQRYLAHIRTIIEEDLDPAVYGEKIDYYYELIDAEVSSDPRKLYTYQQFTNERQVLKNFLQNRRNYLLGNTEINRPYLSISDVVFSAGEEAFVSPRAEQPVTVTARLSGTPATEAVYLYYATGLDGYFEKQPMYDDGQHGDGEAGDGIFGGTIPGFAAGAYVRFYLGAIADDGFGTASYMPRGAEHDVYFYQVLAQPAGSGVVVNELMASNTSTVADQDGDYDDWIELYNNGPEDADLGGWFLSDNPASPRKWTFPEGTILPAGAYLIVWADEDDDQAGLHADFKLSKSGESVILSDPDGIVIDQVDFGAQQDDMGYARVPNGTGSFVIQAPTFGISNDQATAVTDRTGAGSTLLIYPNPASGQVFIEPAISGGRTMQVRISSILGHVVKDMTLDSRQAIDTTGWQPGLYLVIADGVAHKLLIH